MHLKITSPVKLSKVYEHHDMNTGQHVVDILADNLTVEEVITKQEGEELPESRGKFQPKPGEPTQLPVEPSILRRALVPDPDFDVEKEHEKDRKRRGLPTQLPADDRLKLDQPHYKPAPDNELPGIEGPGGKFKPPDFEAPERREEKR